MVESNNIVDFAKHIERPEDVNNQIQAMLISLQSIINSNYTEPLNNIIKSEKNSIDVIQSKEATLINTLSLYATEEQKPVFAKMSNMLSAITTFSILKERLDSVTLDPDMTYHISADEMEGMVTENAAAQTKMLLLFSLMDIFK